MHIRSVLTSLLVFAALAGGLAVPAQAAPFSYADEAGDAADGSASLDIVKVNYDVRQINKGGPPSLVVEMELAAPPQSQLAKYTVEAELEGCGRFDAVYRPGTLVYGTAGIAAADFVIDCPTGDDSTIFDAQFRIEKNTMRWSIALDGLPKAIRAGGKFGGFHAFTGIMEPLTGEVGTNDVGLPVDEATTDRTWSYTGI